MTTTSITNLNNVNLEAVASLIQRIQEQPDTAQTTWRSQVRWTGGFRSESSTRGFPAIGSDEPPALGGDDTAPNPVEQLLAALGNCLAVGYAANATAAGITINDLRIELEGDLDLHTFLGLGPGNAGYETIRATVHLDTDADEQAVTELHNKVTSTSPVGHTLTRTVPVAIELAG